MFKTYYRFVTDVGFFGILRDIYPKLSQIWDMNYGEMVYILL